jgi:hypothetical protein
MQTHLSNILRCLFCGFWLFAGGWTSAAPVISEFLASNNEGVKDEDGDRSDWIEVTNPDSVSVNLNGWTLTDDANQISKWTFPNVTLAAGQRLLIFASGKDRVAAGSELHTNFSLSSSGEYLALLNPVGIKTTEFNPYPKQKEDISYGLASLDATLLNASNPLKYVLAAPPNDPQDDTWTEHDFDDSAWTTASEETDTFSSPNVPRTASTGFFTSVDTETSTTSVSGMPTPVSKVTLRFNISRSSNSSLLVQLTSPQGTTVDVFNNGSNANNFQADLTNYNTQNLNGNWTLTIRESGGSFFSGASSTLNSWSLETSNGIATVNTAGIGYDTTGQDNSRINTNLPSGTTEAWVRIPFNIASLTAYSSLSLRTIHDDGYEAYLNGVQVHSVNTTNPVQSIELGNDFTDTDISQHLGLLQTGQNVLTIRLVNSSAESSDLLMIAELVASQQLADSRYSQTPTPGSPNTGQSFLGFVSDTKFTLGRGFYGSALNEALSSSTSGATLVYTTDGSEPSLSNGTQVLAPDAMTPPSTTIPVNRTVAIRSAAFKTDYISTNTDTNTYIFPTDVKTQSSAITQNTYSLPSSWSGTSPDYGMDTDVVGPGDSFGGVYAGSIESDLLEIPTLSIVMNQDDLFGSNGIYSNPTQSGQNWERATSFELIHPDGSKGFQENCGIRIQGGAFRSFGLTKKKSFRLIFKKEYGVGKLNFDFFGNGATKEFNSIVLRMGSNEGWQWADADGQPQYARDQFGRDALLALGQKTSHGNFMHLYINGVYWGLYNPVERPDSSFAESYFDVPEDEWDGLNSGNVTNASDDPDRINRAEAAWNTLVSRAQAVASAGSRSARHTAYMDAQGKNADGANNSVRENFVDATNYIDYLIVNYYAGNSDWPFKNYYCGRQNSSDSEGFRFFMWDAEWALLLRSTVSTDNVDDNRGVAIPFQDLRVSEAFRIHFADRAHRALFNGGVLYVDPANPNWNPSNPERNMPAALYFNITEGIKAPLVAESARWGDQHRSTPYTVNAEWTTERNNILTDWMPVRSSNFLNILKGENLYPNTAAPAFNQHGGSIASGFQLTMTNPGGSGTLYYTDNGVDPLQINSDGTFSVSSSAQIYSSTRTLNSNVTMKARVLNGAEWSALNEADFILGSTPSSSNLVISEFSYQPSESSTAAGDGDNFEFIEIMNTGLTDIDLSTLEFDRGVTFDFSSLPLANRTLAAGVRAVLVEDTASFQSRYGNSIIVLGEWIGKLSNSGETIRLRIKDGATIREFTYNDKLPWPTCADGLGYSLVLLNPTLNPNHMIPSNWRCSVQLHGIPGGSDALPTFAGNANADDDSDGIPALVEHLLGSSDGDSEDGAGFLSSGLVEVVGLSNTTTHLALTFRKVLGKDDLSAVPEVSTTLQNGSWLTGASHVVLISQVHQADGSVIETWRSVAAVTSTEKIFMRLRVTGG